MPVPEPAPVARETGYRTDTIGTYRDGQFYAAIYGAHRGDGNELGLHRERIRWYAYFHCSASTAAIDSRRFP